MTWQDTTDLLKAAYLAAARQYAPTWHESLVRWDHDVFPVGDLSAELSLVSTKDTHPRPRKVDDRSGADIVTELSQTTVLGVQCKVVSIDPTQFSNAVLAAQRIRDALFTREVQDLLRVEADTNPFPDAERIAIVAPLGPLRAFKTERDGRTELSWIFDATFRTLLVYADPDDGLTLDQVTVEGSIDEDGDGDVDITIDFEVP